MRGNHLESCLRAACRAALVALATCSGLYATPAVAQKFTMKIGTATPRGDQNEWMKLFKQRVEKRGKGTISIQLYPSSQLGAIPRQIEGMQLGTVESWVGPPGFLKGVEPRWQVTDTPGLFRDKEHAQKTITDPAFRDVFLPLGEPKGVLGISIWGVQQLFGSDAKPSDPADRRLPRLEAQGARKRHRSAVAQSPRRGADTIASDGNIARAAAWCDRWRQSGLGDIRAVQILDGGEISD